VPSQLDNHIGSSRWDAHQRSVTIAVMDADEQVLGGGRFSTDLAGFKAMAEYLRPWPDRVWTGDSGIVVGLPVTVIALGSNPIPDRMRTLDQIRTALTRPDDGSSPWPQ